MRILELLKENIGNENVKENEEMSKHTSFKTGGKADIFVKIDNVDSLKYVINLSNKHKIPIFILGNGSNILVTDKGIRGIVCQINITKFEINIQGKDIFVTCGSGCKVPEIAQKLLKEEISGFEFASGIPGTIGGAIRMNAGAHGKEMKDIVVSSSCIDMSGNIFEFDLAQHKFEYRNSIFSNKKYIILESTLKMQSGDKNEINRKMQEYLKYRKENQPFDKPSAGSTFKRGDGFITAKIVDECGLKGKQIGGAQVSTKHAGFIINNGNASSKDILDLIDFVKSTVFEKTGKVIELEVEVVGEE